MKKDESDMLAREVIQKNLYITSRRNYPISISRSRSGDVQITQADGVILIDKYDWGTFLNILEENGEDV